MTVLPFFQLVSVDLLVNRKKPLAITFPADWIISPSSGQVRRLKPIVSTVSCTGVY